LNELAFSQVLVEEYLGDISLDGEQSVQSSGSHTQQAYLCARQNDGLLPTFPIWDDVQTFDGKPWRGIVDVVSGGFPCPTFPLQETEQDLTEKILNVARNGTDYWRGSTKIRICGEQSNARY
jgi:hypothetical protein